MKVCTHCKGKFGMVRYYHYFLQFCSNTCRLAHLAKLAKERERLSSFHRWLFRPP